MRHVIYIIIKNKSKAFYILFYVSLNIFKISLYFIKLGQLLLKILKYF